MHEVFTITVQNNGHLNLTTGNTVARDVPDGIVLLVSCVKVTECIIK